MNNGGEMKKWFLALGLVVAMMIGSPTQAQAQSCGGGTLTGAQPIMNCPSNCTDPNFCNCPTTCAGVTLAIEYCAGYTTESTCNSTEFGKNNWTCGTGGSCSWGTGGSTNSGCGNSVYPTCSGVCPSGTVCKSNAGNAACQCGALVTCADAQEGPKMQTTRLSPTSMRVTWTNPTKPSITSQALILATIEDSLHSQTEGHWSPITDHRTKILRVLRAKRQPLARGRMREGQRQRVQGRARD